MAIFFKSVSLDDAAHALHIFRAHKHQHMPVRRAVMVWLGNTNAKDADVFPVEFGAHLLPDVAKVTLRFGRAGTVPFTVAVTGFDCGVIAGRCRQRIELADKSHFIADIFKAPDAGHQLTATNSRIGHAAVVLLNQADAVAILIFKLHAFEKLAGTALLLAPFRYGHVAGVGSMFLADIGQGNLQVFTPRCSDAAQAPFPPFFCLHTHDRRGDFFRVKKT